MPPQNTTDTDNTESQVSVVSNEQTTGIVDQENPEEQDSNSKKDGIKSILSTVAILVIAPLIALSLTAFVFQSYEVDGPSMQTTLQNHDRLIVYKLPRTIAKITGRPYIPKRTDIIIFSRNDSLEFGSDKPRQLVKRVIALPGERITVKNSVVTVYNNEHPEGFEPDVENKYGKVITNTSGDIDLTVPTDSIFVCGDNRPNSLDSRAFGPVPLSDVVGKLSLRVYPFKSGQSF
jgi:signal peptidase I